MKSIGEQYAGIRVAEPGRRDEIRNFVLAMMRDLYPVGSYYENPYDLANFEEVYVQSADAKFWIAEDTGGRIIGTTAIRRYDERFPKVTSYLQGASVCEVVKCYIDPAWRRNGIGSRLYEAAESFIREAGYQESYLHTSLHLPGGYPFWKAKGYTGRYWESDEIVHMSKMM